MCAADAPRDLNDGLLIYHGYRPDRAALRGARAQPLQNSGTELTRLVMIPDSGHASCYEKMDNTTCCF